MYGGGRSCIQNQGTLQFSLSRDAYYKYLKRMLNAVGIFMEKFHLLMQMAFASIEQAQQHPKKPAFVMPELPKSKWKKMQEKRANRDGQAKRENLLQPTHPLGTFSSLNNDHISPVAHAEKPIGQSEGVRKARQQLAVSISSIKQEERQFQLALAQKMGLAQISFTLPHFLSIPDPSWLTSPVFRILYDLTFNDITLKKVKKCNEISSSDYIQSIPAIQGKLNIFPVVFKTFYSKWNFQLFRLRLEQHLLALPSLQAEDSLDSPIQKVLKRLRIAKIYRYSLTNEMHGLIGNYLFLRQGKPPIAPDPSPAQEGLQLSDIGLFSPSASVEAREEAEIAQYWSLRISQRLPTCHSSFDYDYEKVLEYLRIDAHAPLTLPNFLHYLTRFQNRLILIQDERTITTINKSRKSLDEAEKRYDALAAQASVVRDGRSSLRKPIRPQPEYSVCTPLRIFTKWRSNGCEDGLSVGSIMLRLITRELPSFHAALQLFLRDYDTQVTIPRNKYAMELMTIISDYAALDQQLAEEEAAYRRFLQNTALRTPRRPITLQQPMAPRKEGAAWNLQAVPYEEEKVEQSSFSIQQEDLEGESWDDDEDEDEDDQDSQQEESDEVLEVGGGDEGQALAEVVRTNISEASSSDVQEILPEAAFDQEQADDEEIEIVENSASSAMAGQLPAIVEQESSEQSGQSEQEQQEQAIMIDE